MWGVKGFSDDVMGELKKLKEVDSVFFLEKESRQKYESLEPLMDFLALIVRKLWPKSNKLIG